MHFQHYDYEKQSSPHAILFVCPHIPISVCMCAHTLSMLAKIIHLLHLAQFLNQQPTKDGYFVDNRETFSSFFQ